MPCLGSHQIVFLICVYTHMHTHTHGMHVCTEMFGGLHIPAKQRMGVDSVDGDGGMGVSPRGMDALPEYGAKR